LGGSQSTCDPASRDSSSDGRGLARYFGLEFSRPDQPSSFLPHVARHEPLSGARTRAYADCRTKDGLSRPEILRCLKHDIAREVLRTLREQRMAAREASINASG
jgi:hypothetical protein